MDTTPLIHGPLEILYQDEFIVAINKPRGLLTHKTSLASQAQNHALQMLRDQLNSYVYPAHRLDRKTTGVLLFSFDKESASRIQRNFQDQKIDKKYLAIVRGYFPDDLHLDYPLKNENGKKQEAITNFKCISSSELEFYVDKYPTSRYSLIEALPMTGRMHQIRRHCSHLHHPIIGDRPHGCNKQNRYFKQEYKVNGMMLHAYQLNIKHPRNDHEVKITAPLDEEFIRVRKVLDLY